MWIDWMYLGVSWTRYRVTVEADWSLLFLGLAVLSGVLAILAVVTGHTEPWGLLFILFTFLSGLTGLYRYCLQFRFRRRAKKWSW